MTQHFVAQEWSSQDCAGLGSCTSWGTGLWGAAEATVPTSWTDWGATGIANQTQLMQQRKHSWTFPTIAGKFTPSTPVQGAVGLRNTGEKVRTACKAFSLSAAPSLQGTHQKSQSIRSTDHCRAPETPLVVPWLSPGSPHQRTGFNRGSSSSLGTYLDLQAHPTGFLYSLAKNPLGLSCPPPPQGLAAHCPRAWQQGSNTPQTPIMNFSRMLCSSELQRHLTHPSSPSSWHNRVNKTYYV